MEFAALQLLFVAWRDQMLGKNARQFVSVDLHVDQMHRQGELLDVQEAVAIHVGQFPYFR